MAYITAWKGQFVKADGTLRDIRFVEMADLPAGFVEPHQTLRPARLATGMRLVWEVGVGVKTYNAGAETHAPTRADVRADKLRPTE